MTYSVSHLQRPGKSREQMACLRKENAVCLERTSDVQPLLDASMPEAAVSTSCSGRSIGRGHGNGDSDFYNDVVREGCSQENHARVPPKTDSKYKFFQRFMQSFRFGPK